MLETLTVFWLFLMAFAFGTITGMVLLEEMGD